jgi:hypothetical protein
MVGAMKMKDHALHQKVLAEVVQGYIAIVDGPGSFSVEDFVDMYPDAKVSMASLFYVQPFK